MFYKAKKCRKYVNIEFTVWWLCTNWSSRSINKTSPNCQNLPPTITASSSHYFVWTTLSSKVDSLYLLFQHISKSIHIRVFLAIFIFSILFMRWLHIPVLSFSLLYRISLWGYRTNSSVSSSLDKHLYSVPMRLLCIMFQTAFSHVIWCTSEYFSLAVYPRLEVLSYRSMFSFSTYQKRHIVYASPFLPQIWFCLFQLWSFRQHSFFFLWFIRLCFF